MESKPTERNTVDYNGVLIQISANLSNALNTYGPSSDQYQTVLEMLKDCLRDVDKTRNEGSQNLDPEVLGLAMGFLELGE
ncbi:hypothetical protein BJX61DRAFT_539806 [Aspergillus egyptiacus]|nr:hypothetical protein BJX61DRAFT_539806 [Aspergillus egyptiacus]